MTTLLADGIFSGVQGILLMLLPIAGSLMLAYGAYQVVADLRGADRRRVVKRLQGDSRGRDSRDEDKLIDLRRGTHEAAGTLGQFVSKLSFTPKFQTVLDQCNVARSAPKLLVNMFAAAVCATAVLFVLGIHPIAALGVGAGVFIVPILYFFKRRKKRMNRLIEQLPDVFEMLSQALRAGHSLASGMQLISKQLPDPAGTEFGRVFHEQNLGLKIEDALRNLAERVSLLDVRFFVTAVLIQRQTGGDLAEVLDKIGSVIRDRIQLFGMVKALTAEGRLSGYVLLALPPLVFFVMLFVNRDYANMLIDTPAGRMMTTVAIVMQLMGWAMIKKIVNIKV